MLELSAPSFLAAANNLVRLRTLFGSITTSDELLIPQSVENISGMVESFKVEAEKLGARLSAVAAERLLLTIRREPCEMTVGHAVGALADIESRFVDHLTEIQLFVLNPQETPFLAPADSLVDMEGFSTAFPSAAFEVEEAAKCIALGRYTASVFHGMRMMEVGIRALSKRLGVPDPTRPAEKNWNIILKTIKEKIDELWPPNTRLAGSEGTAFEELYANLDAVRNPWRNATMHVETIYAPHEALHIIRCAAFFLRRLSKLTDENGVPPPDPALPVIEEN
jgi:hypothetical protein